MNSPFVPSERQVDATSFILPVHLALFKILLFCKNLGAFELSDFFSASYATTHPSLGTCSGHYLPTAVPYRVPQGYVLGPLWFRVHIHDLCNIVIYSGYLLFADDIKTSGFIISINNCTLIRPDINCIKG
jgi:hypothetical protein